LIKINIFPSFHRQKVKKSKIRNEFKNENLVFIFLKKFKLEGSSQENQKNCVQNANIYKITLIENFTISVGIQNVNE